jgi:cytochrome c553
MRTMTTTRKFGLTAAVFTLACLTGCERPAADVTEAGAALAQEKGCIACHGLNGKGTGPTFPNLGGQWPSYLRTQLQKYRDGDRVNAIMNPLAGELSDREIDVLAAYYAGQ